MSELFLVDDHALVREGLRAMLEAAGHQVVGEAGEATPALAELVRLEPEIALIDLNLGQRSGLELLAEMQRRRLATRVIVLSMSVRPQHVAEALRLGALGYVLKDSSAAELLAALDAVSQGRRHLGTSVAELAARGLADQGRNMAELSARERQVLVLVARGASSNQIGHELHLSPKTVDTYRSRLMAKLGLEDVPALVRWAIREGLIGVDEP
ncbi:response regulator transcription factor [Ideonella sp.]|uniref:response regulator transcription factor n=1 Tax=Ideonella sp. TaxID=1929293 RepID=UPI002B4A58E1|nr:response regulator transcription factor [Ideonella sp.]HJV71391.1 response regulator transcription factor [Ideonella sp.]